MKLLSKLIGCGILSIVLFFVACTSIDEPEEEPTVVKVEGENFPVDFPAVHGSQFDEWSPPDGDMNLTRAFVDESLIDDFV